MTKLKHRYCLWCRRHWRWTIISGEERSKKQVLVVWHQLSAQSITLSYSQDGWEEAVPQIDHCFHSAVAAGHNESHACWEVRVERVSLPLGHHFIPLPPPIKTSMHDSKEFQFASDSLGGTDGLITKWRGEMLPPVMWPPGYDVVIRPNLDQLVVVRA